MRYYSVHQLSYEMMTVVRDASMDMLVIRSDRHSKGQLSGQECMLQTRDSRSNSFLYRAMLQISTHEVVHADCAKMAAAAILKNRKIALSQRRIDKFRQNLA